MAFWRMVAFLTVAQTTIAGSSIASEIKCIGEVAIKNESKAGPAVPEERYYILDDSRRELKLYDPEMGGILICNGYHHCDVSYGQTQISMTATDQEGARRFFQISRDTGRITDGVYKENLFNMGTAKEFNGKCEPAKLPPLKQARF